MSSQAMVPFFINDEGKPANFSDYETIITQYFDLRPRQATATNISGVQIALDKKSDLSYTVSEYIDNSDTAFVAAAVQALIAIPSPSSTPGPGGGGLIEHPFFVDWMSSVWYHLPMLRH